MSDKIDNLTFFQDCEDEKLLQWKHLVSSAISDDDIQNNDFETKAKSSKSYNQTELSLTTEEFPGICSIQYNDLNFNPDLNWNQNPVNFEHQKQYYHYSNEEVNYNTDLDHFNYEGINEQYESCHGVLYDDNNEEPHTQTYSNGEFDPLNDIENEYYDENNNFDEMNGIVDMAMAVEDVLAVSCPSIIFSSGAVYAVLYDSNCGGDITIAANSISKAFIEASSCKPCRHMLSGQCYRKDCSFRHNLEGITCRYWLMQAGCSATSVEEGGVII